MGPLDGRVRPGQTLNDLIPRSTIEVPYTLNVPEKIEICGSFMYKRCPGPTMFLRNSRSSRCTVQTKSRRILFIERPSSFIYRETHATYTI